VCISHVTVIDMETGNETQNRTVVISADGISEVRDSKGGKHWRAPTPVSPTIRDGSTFRPRFENSGAIMHSTTQVRHRGQNLRTAHGNTRRDAPRRCTNHGGNRLGLGVPFTYAGFWLQDELALLVRAGLTPAQVLEAATIGPARFLGTERDLGSVEKGKIADLLLLDADPLQDIHNTTRISGVFLSGRYLDRVALGKLLKEAEAAANSASEVKAYVH
jgi:Amidohydrolase family